MLRQYTNENDSQQDFTFAGQLRDETGNSYLIQPRDYRLLPQAAAWFPRSQTRIVQWGGGDEWFVFSIPHQLARDKGFLDPARRVR